MSGCTGALFLYDNHKVPCNYFIDAHLQCLAYSDSCEISPSSWIDTMVGRALFSSTCYESRGRLDYSHLPNEHAGQKLSHHKRLMNPNFRGWVASITSAYSYGTSGVVDYGFSPSMYAQRVSCERREEDGKLSSMMEVLLTLENFTMSASMHGWACITKTHT